MTEREPIADLDPPSASPGGRHALAPRATLLERAEIFWISSVRPSEHTDRSAPTRRRTP